MSAEDKSFCLDLQPTTLTESTSGSNGNVMYLRSASYSKSSITTVIGKKQKGMVAELERHVA